MTVAEVVSKFIAFFSVILITRYLTEGEFGQYNFVLAFGLIFGVLANFGFGAFTTREIAKDRRRAKKIIGNLLSLKLILSGAVLLLLFLTAQFIDKPSYIIIGLYMVGFLTVSDSIRALWGSVFQASERMSYLSLTRLGERVLYLAVLAFVIYFDKGLLWIIGALLVSSFAFTILEVFLIHYKFTKISFKFDKPFIKMALLGTVFFVINDIFIVIFFKIDTVMISFMRGDIETAVYSAAYNLLYAIIFIPTVLSTVLYPALTRFYKKNQKMFRLSLPLVIKYYFLSSLPVVAFVFIFPTQIITLIYKDKYFDSIPALKVLAFGMTFVFLNFVLSMVLNTVEKQKFVALASFSAMVLNLILNFLLIPDYGIMGASVATVATEFLFCSILLLFVNRELGVVTKGNLLKLAGVVLAVLVGLGLVFAFSPNPYVSYLIFIAVLAGLLLLFKIVTKKDWEYFKEALHLK